MPPGWRSLVKKSSFMASFYPVARGLETANRPGRVHRRLWHCNSVPNGYDPGAFFATVEPHVASAAGVIAAARIGGP